MFILFSTTSFASSLKDNLAYLDAATLKAEFWALNCVMMAQKDKIITRDCRSAENSVRSIDKKLAKLIDNLTLDTSLNGPVFYAAMDKIKQYRSRLRKIKSNLYLAKKTTGVYNWTNKIYPAYYQQR
jgi:hypothetical protein